MICPKCKNDMIMIEFEGVEVDRCSSCKGIWFDVGESESLREMNAADAIDIGDPLVGKETNQINRYRCPRCSGGMMRKVDSRDLKIWYEECTSCRGSFLDAGEFTGLTEHSISRLIKRAASFK